LEGAQFWQKAAVSCDGQLLKEKKEQ